MACVGSVYSVDRLVRSPADIVAALFRDDIPPDKDFSQRPRPRFKHTTAHFAKEYQDGDETLTVSATHEGFGWASGEIERRHQAEQTLVLLMDGQHSLWDTAALHSFRGTVVEILDRGFKLCERNSVRNSPKSRASDNPEPFSIRQQKNDCGGYVQPRSPSPKFAAKSNSADC